MLGNARSCVSVTSERNIVFSVNSQQPMTTGVLTGLVFTAFGLRQATL